MNPEVENAAEKELMDELRLLEEKIEEVGGALRKLREEKSALEEECRVLRRERAEAADTLGRLIDKVDAIRGEI